MLLTVRLSLEYVQTYLNLSMILEAYSDLQLSALSWMWFKAQRACFNLQDVICFKKSFPEIQQKSEQMNLELTSQRRALGKLLLWQNPFSKLSALFLRKTVSSWVCHTSFHLTAESDNSESASFALLPPTPFSVVFISPFKTTVLLYYLSSGKTYRIEHF